ncbi:MAG: hypothetical protein SGI73_02510 [Chloroflexota bacterium]|nr:hypothetical protein [Chloroflexota bacterium]
MKQLEVSADVFAKIAAIADQKQISLNEALRSLLIGSQAFPVDFDEAEAAAKQLPIEGFIGIFDDDISDLSVNIREHMKTYWQEKATSHDHTD